MNFPPNMAGMGPNGPMVSMPSSMSSGKSYSVLYEAFAFRLTWSLTFLFLRLACSRYKVVIFKVIPVIYLSGLVTIFKCAEQISKEILKPQNNQNQNQNFIIFVNRVLDAFENYTPV